MKYAFLLIRLAIGTTFFGHGLVRLPILDKFSGWMLGQFEKSYLPAQIVQVFSYILPFAELIVGLLVLLGLFLRQASIAGGLVMIALIFGTTTIQQWDNLPSQMIHVAFFAYLLAYEHNDIYSLDKLRAHRKLK